MPLHDTSYPVFGRLVDLVTARSPLQKKALNAFLTTRDEVFFQRAEGFARGLAGLLEDSGMDEGYVADAYLRMCRDMFKEQVGF